MIPHGSMGIMKDLHGFALRGRLPDIISNILKEGFFKVRVGSTFSDSHPQEMGVPQGGILVVTLISVKINSIVQCLKPDVDCSLYVDDFQICYRSSSMSIIERQLQLCLYRSRYLDPQLFLDQSPIPVVEETKFMGVIFNRKLSFVPHLKHQKVCFESP